MVIPRSTCGCLRALTIHSGALGAHVTAPTTVSVLVSVLAVWCWRRAGFCVDVWLSER
ncbi:MAG: hypothetical protein WBR33_09980 [Pseudonocardiaceae bacterium]